MITLLLLIRTIHGYNYSTSTLCAPKQCNTASSLRDCYGIQYCQWTGSYSIFSSGSGAQCIPAFCADQQDEIDCNRIWGCYYITNEERCSVVNPLEKLIEKLYGDFSCSYLSQSQCNNDIACTWVRDICRPKICSDIKQSSSCGIMLSENDILQCRWQNNQCTDPSDLSYLNQVQCNSTYSTHYWDDQNDICLPCSGMILISIFILYLI